MEGLIERAIEFFIESLRWFLGLIDRFSSFLRAELGPRKFIILIGLLIGWLIGSTFLTQKKELSLRKTALCKECGKFYEGNPRFCPNCGKQIL